jgi:transketolase
MSEKEELSQLAINTIRTLSIDAVQQAKSGHPDTPMALAPFIYALWNRVIPTPADRFIVPTAATSGTMYCRGSCRAAP